MNVSDLNLSPEAEEAIVAMLEYCLEHRIGLGQDEGFTLKNEGEEHPWVHELKSLLTHKPRPGKLDALLGAPKEDNGFYDLCDTYKGKWLDVMLHEPTGEWRGMYDSRDVTGFFPTREQARVALIKWLSCEA